MDRNKLINDSKLLSLVLRHKPETIGIKLDKHGWANVKELIEGMKHKTVFSIEWLEYIVDTDEKQRYTFNEDKSLIRANQGHSIAVDVEMQICEPPEFLFHGSATKYEESIDLHGLVPKSRLYVHLSSDVTTAIEVGKRHGVPIVYSVHAGRMYRDGYKFMLSDNGVWLTDQVNKVYLYKFTKVKEIDRLTRRNKYGQAVGNPYPNTVSELDKLLERLAMYEDETELGRISQYYTGNLKELYKEDV